MKAYILRDSKTRKITTISAADDAAALEVAKACSAITGHNVYLHRMSDLSLIAKVCYTGAVK